MVYFYPSAFTKGCDLEAHTFAPELMQQLRNMGLKVELVSPQQAAMSRGYWVGLQIDPTTGVMKGGIERGSESGVDGY